MKLLLDTHILLWAAGEPDCLPAEAKTMINNIENSLFFSVASIWEIIIKNSLGRADFYVDAHLLRRGLLDNGYQELSIENRHILTIPTLPLIHKDPFDRILVAQATAEAITLLTADSLVGQYPGILLVK